MKDLRVWLRGADDLLVGTIRGDARGETFFKFDENFVELGSERPILSLLWHAPGDEAKTLLRMRRSGDKIGRLGHLPSWFSGLLPEGALRQLVEGELGPGKHGEAEVLARLGADLPGAVVVSDAENRELSPPRGWAAPMQGRIHFSLAGVQMKFAADLHKDRVTFPALGMGGAFIAKTTSEMIPDMVEAEHMAMTLARHVGIETVDFRLVPSDHVDGVPEEYLGSGPFVFVSRRFDRAEDGRIHMEDFAQIAEAEGDRKYTAGTYETCLNVVRRFSSDPGSDLRQALRRTINDVLVGNGDAHLKNWSIVHGPAGPRLSQAYDVVPTALWTNNRLALRMAGTYTMENVGLDRLQRIGTFVGLPATEVADIARDMVAAALEIWPGCEAASNVALSVRDHLVARLPGLRLVQEARPCPPVPGFTFDVTEDAEPAGGIAP